MRVASNKVKFIKQLAITLGTNGVPEDGFTILSIAAMCITVCTHKVLQDGDKKVPIAVTYVAEFSILVTVMFMNKIRPVHRLSKASKCSASPVRAPQRLLKVCRRLATPVRAPQRLSKASTRLATPVRALQRLSKASTRLATPVRASQRLSKASTRLATPVRAPQ